MLYNYLICYFSDPGILPKNLKGRPVEITTNEIKNKTKDKNTILKVEDEKNKSSSFYSLKESKFLVTISSCLIL